MIVNLNTITTEGRNPNTIDIDSVSTLEMIKKINEEDKTVATSVEKVLPEITLLIDEIACKFLLGGRLIYLGAGTSGRIGILDAVECPPTFGVSSEMVMGIMAGGMNAFAKAVEGAEDSKELAVHDLKEVNISQYDILIGIAASGRTPYVLGGIEYAKSLGITTGCITTSDSSPLASLVDYPIACITGPEPLTGSTRMKSGTAQKMICNMLSTGAMIKLGKVYENYLIDLRATNKKLVSRSIKIITDITGMTYSFAEQRLSELQTVKNVLFSYFTGITDLELITNYLEKHFGHIRKAVEDANELR